MSKIEITAAVAENMPDEKRMRDVLSIIDNGEWELLTKAAAVQQMLDETSFIPVSDFLQSMGYLDVFYHDDHLIFVVSDEIKTKVMALQGTSFPKERARLHLLNDYALATTSLYGLIGQEDFVELFNSQNKEKTNTDEVFDALMRFVSLNAGYCFWEEYLVNDAFEENDFKDVERYAKVMASKPRYTPPKDALLRYSDPDYYEITPQVKALRGFILSNLCDDPDEADDIIDEIHDLIAQEAKMQSIIDVFNKRDISFTGMEQMQNMMSLVMDVMNNTRLWLNHGHTPNELASIEKPHLKELKSRPARVQKVGRNEPCPCGSGKKYKRCCGQG